MNKKSHQIPTALCLLLLSWLGSCQREPGIECDGSLSVAVVLTQDSDCETPTGRLEVLGSGGLGEYQYQLDGGAFQSGTIFTEVSTGDHQIRVRDAGDCTAEAEAQLASGLVLTDILPIINQYCAIPECHDGSQDQPNFKIVNVVLDRGVIDQITRCGPDYAPGGRSRFSEYEPDPNDCLLGGRWRPGIKELFQAINKYAAIIPQWLSKHRL